MPIHKIQVYEYECVHCHHKWINRINGQDGPIPKNCAKCKRQNWKGGDQIDEDLITPGERSLRMRLYKFEGTLNRCMGEGREYRPNALCEAFLNVNPRPSMKELQYALYPLGWDPRQRKWIGYVKDPDNPGYLKFDSTGKQHFKLLIEEMITRRNFMKRIIKERGSEDDRKFLIVWEEGEKQDIKKLPKETQSMMREIINKKS